MRTAVLAVVLLLAGCGFQLQGRRVMPLALSTLHIEAIDEQSDFTRALRAALQASGVRLVPSPAADGATLRIARDELTERVLSVDARNIPTNYELTYKVEVQVQAGGQELMAVKPFELSRNYSFDVRKRLAKEREKEILQADLARDMTSVVMRTLSEL
jgi:LPS-assembly lipoprotein